MHAIGEEAARKAIDLIVRQAMRDVFKLCIATAEELADKIESGELEMDAPEALRFIAMMFRTSASKE